MALLVKIGADIRDFDKAMKRMTRDTETIAKKLTGTGKALTTAVTVPVLGIGAAAVKTASDFDGAMSKVQAISGATAEEFSQLRQLAQDLGATTKFSASEAAEGMQYMAMAGWDTQQIMSALPGVLDLAAASGEDLGLVSDIVTDAMTAFGLSADQATRFADVLASASSNSNTNVALMGETFKYVAPLAGTLGFSIEDTALAVGLMANAGIKGSQAGTAMRAAFSSMVSPSDKAAEAMDTLGISMTDNEGNMLSLEGVMLQLREKFDGLTEAQQAQYAADIFGREAMSGMLAIINAAPADYDKLREATTEYTGTAEEMAATMQDNLGGQLTKLKSALEGVAIQLGDILMPVITKVVEKINSWVTAFGNLDPGLREAIVKVGLVVAAIGPLLIAAGSIVSTFGKISAALNILGPMFSAMPAALGPVGIAIGAIVAAGVLLYKNWEDVSAFAGTLWEGIRTTAETVAEGVKGAFGGIGDFLEGVFGGVADVIKGFLNAIITCINFVIDGLNEISFDVPKWVPGIGGRSIGSNIPKVPMLAEGGLATGATAAIIGEGADDEAVLPLNAAVYDRLAEGIASALARTGSGGSGGSYSGLSDSAEGAASGLDKMRERLQGLSLVLGASTGGLASLSAVLSPLQPILMGVMDVLGPAIDSALKPLLGLMYQLGFTLGKWLLPVIEALGEGIAWVVEKIVGVINAVIDGINGVIRLLNKIPGVNIGRLGRISMESVEMGAPGFDYQEPTPVSGSTTETVTEEDDKPSQVLYVTLNVTSPAEAMRELRVLEKQLVV
jgi:TP901 family phage tail tape measure protein